MAKAKRATKRIAADLRAYEVLNLKLEGLSDRVIAERMGAKFGRRFSINTINRDWHGVLATQAAVNADATNKLRELQTQRLERLLAAVWPDAMTGRKPKSVEQCRRIIESISRINGLIREPGDAEDNPLHVKSDLKVTYDFSLLDDAALDAIVVTADRLALPEPKPIAVPEGGANAGGGTA